MYAQQAEAFAVGSPIKVHIYTIDQLSTGDIGQQPIPCQQDDYS